jgi:HD-like signal output (HDOD) protein/CheY-like chemotaxis protein
MHPVTDAGAAAVSDAARGDDHGRKRILFVDDEPRVLDALRRMLRGSRHEWDMTFVAGGDAALAALEAAPFDVIVSDMRMPGMDGATLLARVKERFPNVVRMVLSGYTELEAALRAVPVAHQFLSKPCEADVLREVIARALHLQRLLGGEHIHRAIGTMAALPSLPSVYGELTHALADPDVSLRILADIVERDVGMSAKLLQLVNSGFFGLPRRVANAQTAVNLLGITMLKSLVLSVDVFRSFAGVTLPGFSLERLHDHALVTAAIAARLVDDTRQIEDAFTAAMLHDVGKLVLATRAPQQFARALAAAHEQGRPMHDVEREIEGVTHAEIGAYLLGIWGLPYGIVEAVASHHAAAPVGRRFDLAAVVAVANALAHEHEPEGAGHAHDVERYAAALECADRVPRWRAIAAEQVRAARS